MDAFSWWIIQLLRMGSLNFTPPILQLKNPLKLHWADQNLIHRGLHDPLTWSIWLSAPLYPPHCTHHTLDTTLYTPYSTHHTVHTTLNTPYSTHYTVHTTLYSVHTTLQTTLHTTLYTLHYIHHTTHHTAPTTLYAPHLSNSFYLTTAAPVKD